MTRTNTVADAPPERVAKLLDTIPLRKVGRPEDQAKAMLYLASEDASYITGTELIVDGGVLAD